ASGARTGAGVPCPRAGAGDTGPAHPWLVTITGFPANPGGPHGDVRKGQGMKLKGRLVQLEARERAFHHHLEKARESTATLHAAARSLSPMVVVGTGLTVGALLARLPSKTWSLPVAGLFVVGRQAARLPVGRWL